MALTHFYKIASQFPEIHQQAMTVSEEDARVINDQKGKMWTGTVDPKNSLGFSIDLNIKLNDALLKAGSKNRFDFAGILQSLPSLLDANKYGPELIVEIGGSREKLEEVLNRNE